MSQFTNSYILSKTTFWSQCEVYSSSKWNEADISIHKFRFSKESSFSKTFSPMALYKPLFPTSQGGFNMWLPSFRSKAVAISLFIHCIQHSEILQKIICSESLLCPNSNINTFDLLTANSNWLWLKSAVNLINLLKIVPKIAHNTLMWSCKFIKAFGIVRGRSNTQEEINSANVASFKSRNKVKSFLILVKANSLPVKVGTRCPLCTPVDLATEIFQQEIARIPNLINKIILS
eukprot:TRINITY_DN1014_c0_g1_i5.p1 TRINITY_DN1014_c0_g1~~TRINITY_DN1014_c0_g1_i5.p1  ORF type:complete len:233 (-),score=-6.09 TRINITY_DN1014_c0_g1_i5:4-702(-)